jgi:uncharacterized membrane protein
MEYDDDDVKSGYYNYNYEFLIQILVLRREFETYKKKALAFFCAFLIFELRNTIKFINRCKANLLLWYISVVILKLLLVAAMEWEQSA